MTNKELQDILSAFPADAEVMTQFDPFARWDIALVQYDKDRDTIVII